MSETKLRLTIVVDYTVDGEVADEVYGTQDPQQMAAIDYQSIVDDLATAMEIINYAAESDLDFKVEVVA